MILTFPMDEYSTGCIAWGKITMSRGAAIAGDSPVKSTVFGTGTERLMFMMNVNARKTNQPGSKDGMLYESATVMTFARQDDPGAAKLADVVRKLRRSDPVLVFGKYTPPREETTRNNFILHGIEAFAVIPLAWTYDILNALYAQIVSQAEPPRPIKPRSVTRTASPKKAPAVQKRTEEEIPQITHPVVMEKGDWFE